MRPIFPVFLVEDLRSAAPRALQKLLRVGYRAIDIFDGAHRNSTMTRIKRLQPEAAQSCERIDIVTDATRFGDVGERAAGENTVGGEKQTLSRFDDRDTARGVTRRVKNAEAMVAEIDAGHILKPQMHPHGKFVQIVSFVHRDIVIAGNHFGGGQPVGGDYGGFVKVAVGADVIAMFVRVDDEIDVSHFETDLEKSFLQYRKILIGSGIDHDILVISFDDVAVAAAVQSVDLKDSRPKLGYASI